MNAIEALRLCTALDVKTVLDIGSGNGVHAKEFKDCGFDITTCDLKDADHNGIYTDIEFPQKYDLIWCSHVLEHQLNVNQFLRKIGSDLSDDGYLAVTVPPLKNEIVGGHVTLWNAGLLLYNLVLAGFDCSQAKVKTYGYNISVIVRNSQIQLPGLRMDFGDIETLSRYFPMDVRNGFHGVLEEVNWP